LLDSKVYFCLVISLKGIDNTVFFAIIYLYLTKAVGGIYEK